MLKTKVGCSAAKNNYDSGVESATKANLSTAKVGVLFTSCEMNQNEVISGIRSISEVPLIGCTSSAAICSNEGYFNSEDGYTGIMSFGGDIEVGVAGHAKKEGENAREIGRKIAKEAMKGLNGERPNYFFMTASPAEEEEYLLGIEDVIGSVPVFGGSAADNTVEGKWSIICNDAVFSDGCAICLFKTDAEIKNIYTGAYKETEDVGIITEVRNDRTLVSIDSVPAVKKYLEWTNKNESEVMGNDLLVATIFNPLGVKDMIGRVTGIRHPMFANDDYSMNIGARLTPKTAVIRMHLEPEEMIEANPKTIKELDKLMVNEAESYLLVHCGGRRLGLAIEGLEDKIYPAVKEVTKDKEFLMTFTFGEYGRGDNSANTVGGLSLSYTGFGK